MKRSIGKKVRKECVPVLWLGRLTSVLIKHLVQIIARMILISKEGSYKTLNISRLWCKKSYPIKSGFWFHV